MYSRELRHVHLRVKDERGRHLLHSQPLHQLVQQRGLARSHLSGEQHESLAALNTVGETRQRLLRVPRQKKVTRVRIDIERIRPQSKEFLVHQLLTSTASRLSSSDGCEMLRGLP